MHYSNLFNLAPCFYAGGKVKRELDNESPLRHLKRRGPGTALCASPSRRAQCNALPSHVRVGTKLSPFNASQWKRTRHCTLRLSIKTRGRWQSLNSCTHGILVYGLNLADLSLSFYWSCEVSDFCRKGLSFLGQL